MKRVPASEAVWNVLCRLSNRNRGTGAFKRRWRMEIIAVPEKGRTSHLRLDILENRS